MQHIDQIRIPVRAEARVACVLLALAYSGGALSAQQASTPQALSLPASGRISLGQVSAQQITLPAGASVLQPSVMVTGNYQGSVPRAAVESGMSSCQSRACERD